MAHSAGAPYALSFANKVPERIRGEILLLAPWVGDVEGGSCCPPKSVILRLTLPDQLVTNGSSMYQLVYLRPPRLQSGKSRLGCLANLQHLPTGVLATTPSPRCQHHLTHHLRVDPQIRAPVRPRLSPTQVWCGVLAILRVSSVTTMICETLMAVSTVGVLLASGALALNAVAR